MIAFMPLLGALAVAFCCISTLSFAQSPPADEPGRTTPAPAASPPPGPRAIPEVIEPAPRRETAVPPPAETQSGSDVRDRTPPFNPDTAQPPTPLRIVPGSHAP